MMKTDYILYFVDGTVLKKTYRDLLRKIPLLRGVNSNPYQRLSAKKILKSQIRDKEFVQGYNFAHLLRYEKVKTEPSHSVVVYKVTKGFLFKKIHFEYERSF